MKEIIKVACWEFIKGIKNKTFLFLTFVFPIIMIIIMGVVAYFSVQGDGGQDLYLAIIDETEFVAEVLEESFSANEFKAEFISINKLEEIESILAEEGYDGILYIPEKVVETNQVYYYFKEISGLETGFIRDILTDILVNKRLVEKGYSPLEIKELTANVKISTRLVKGEEDEDFTFGIILPFFLAMLMVFAVFMSGSILLQSIIKEKTNRIVEIILSSISARTLMIGKIIGYALLSLVQIGIWLSAGILVILYFDPEMLTLIFSSKTLLMLVYVFFNFILVASLNAIIGSSMRDAQSGNQSAGLFILIPIIPIYFTSPIMNNPNGVLSRVLSYIPIFTPTTMMIRLGISTPSIWEIIGTILLLTISSYLLMLLASRLFRIGMLMYGKNANLKELLKWARSKDY